ncbi:hypothetical protein E2C01_086737 [Portunus trituberculatus]|uniref:Uncharacterized protein n=1 Tax=Portunus trituberculatus TaxID=210409 RepID=A0A5B7JBC5_PORTR|nr:hypothetical protein [Portunus trituberculatus]
MTDTRNMWPSARLFMSWVWTRSKTRYRREPRTPSLPLPLLLSRPARPLEALEGKQTAICRTPSCLPARLPAWRRPCVGVAPTNRVILTRPNTASGPWFSVGE